MPVFFHLKKDKKYLFINKHNHIYDAFKEFLNITNTIHLFYKKTIFFPEPQFF